MKILAIIGSKYKGSFNLQLAQAARDVVGNRAEFEILDYADVPFFDMDIEHPAPEAVVAIRKKVQEADGLWFFTPEYNHSYSGYMKNLLDWLSRPTDDPNEGKPLDGKAATISGVSRGMSGASIALDHLMELLNILNMRVLYKNRVTVANAMSLCREPGVMELPEDSVQFLRQQADAFLYFIQK